MRAKRLPEDFALTVADHEFARNRGWDAERRKAEFERFCDHAVSKGRKLTDWHAGWRTWVTSPYNHGKANGSKPKTLSDVIRELGETVRSDESADADWVLPESGRH